MLPKVIYIFKAIQIQVPTTFFIELEKNDTKVHLENTHTQLRGAITILKNVELMGKPQFRYSGHTIQWWLLKQHDTGKRQRGGPMELNRNN